MSSPALETLRFLRHSPEPANNLPRNTRSMLMGWCRHRDVSLEEFLDLVWQGKEDTPERRARYSQAWRAWGEKRSPNNKYVEAVLMMLYPDTCFTNKNARIYRQTHALKTSRVVTGLSKSKGQMTIAENVERLKFPKRAPSSSAPTTWA